MSEEINRYTRIIEDPHSSDAEKAQAYIRRGNVYKNQEKYDFAIADYGQVIDLCTDDNDKAGAYIRRGNAYSEQKKYDLAIEDYGQAIDLYTDHDDKAWVYLWRGIAYSEQKKYDLAIEDYGRAIDLYTHDNDKARVYKKRGDAYSKQGKYDLAIKDYEQAIDLYTDDNDKARAYNIRGDVYSEQEKYDFAIKDYGQAIKLFTNNEEKAEAYIRRGHTCRSQERYDLAIEDYTQAIDLHTDDNDKARMYSWRGIAYSQQEKYNFAIKDYGQAIKLHTDNDEKAWVYSWRGNAYKEQEKYEEAIEDCGQAIDLYTDDNDKAWMYLWRGIAYSWQGKYEEAIEDYGQAIDLYTDDHDKAWMYSWRGITYSEQEKYNLAIKDYGQAIDLYTDDNDKARAYNNRGIARLQLKKYSDAIDDLTRALQGGISTVNINRNKPDTKKNSIEQHIVSVFESVACILNTLKVKKKKVKKNSDDTVKYLSHTTKLSVFTKHLMPTDKHAEPTLAKFRMYHIAYANDPTEGTVLFDTLDIPHDKREVSAYMSYAMVASFCGGADTQALDNLPIWNTYGDNAKGIALLFKTDDLAYGGQGHAIPTTLPQRPEYFGNDNKTQKLLGASTQDEKTKEKAKPQPILYEVHYVNKDDKVGDKSDKVVDKKIKNIKRCLNAIEKKDKQTSDVYSKTLELLSGVRYLIKDATYAYEKEYRLIYFANEKDDTPDILKSEGIAEQSEESEDTQEQYTPRIYVETDILQKLCGVRTAPKVSTDQLLYIRYLLRFFQKKDKLSYLEEKQVHTSSISYR